MIREKAFAKASAFFITSLKGCLEITQFGSQFPCFSLCQFIQNLPKLWSVVHFPGMSEFV